MQHDVVSMMANVNESVITLSLATPATIKNAFTEMMNDEAWHVTFFQTALIQAGAPPRPKLTFKGLVQTNLSNFATMSRTFENTGVAAFLMAMPAMSNKDYTAAAASILTIEARHAEVLPSLYIRSVIFAYYTFVRPCVKRNASYVNTVLMEDLYV